MKRLFKQLTCLAALAILPCTMMLQAADLTWDADPVNTTAPQDGAGIWDTTTNTWWDGANNVVWDSATPANAIFGAGSGTAGTVSNAVAITVGNITFSAASSGTYTITAAAANPVTLSGTPKITNNVDAALNVVLAGTGFTKEGSGTLSIRPLANNTYVGATIVNAGRLALNSSSANRVLIPGDLTINSGATVTNTGSAGPIAATSTVTVNTNGTFNANASGGSTTFASLILNGGIVFQNGSETLVNTSVDARSGIIAQAGGATGKLDGNLTKSTSGTVLFTSRGSSSSLGLGNTIVNDGTLLLDYTQSSSKLTDAGTLTINGGTLAFTNGSTTETVGTVTLTGGVITNAGGTSKLSVPSGNYDVRTGAVYTVFAGAAGLAKTTPGTVVLAAVHTYTGATVISDGILQLGDGTTSGTVNSSAITDNATLALNPGGSATISSVISGTGSLTKIGTGTAALTPINSYQGSTTVSNGILTIDSDATLGDGTGTLNLSGGTLSSTAGRTASSAPVANPINLTADSAITTTSASATVDFNMNNNSIAGSAGTLTFSNAAASGTGVFQPRFSGNGFNFNRPIIIANGGFGTTRLDSYNTTGTTQTFSGTISGTGGYRRNASPSGTGGTTVMTGNNTYTGNTDVNQGVLIVNGTLGASTVTVAANGTLSGNGTINGPVTVSGTLSPGVSIGILTISNSLTFQSAGTHSAELNKSLGTNDLVRGLTTVTYGGTLVVNNLSGTLAANDTFTLFSAATYAGVFITTNLPALDPGLAWDTTGLTSNGSIKVVAAAAAQPTLNITPTGNTRQFSWTGSFKLQAQTNNSNAGLNNNWGDYPGGDVSGVTVTIDPANPAVFFRLVSVP